MRCLLAAGGTCGSDALILRQCARDGLAAQPSRVLSSWEVSSARALALFAVFIRRALGNSRKASVVSRFLFIAVLQW